MIDKDFFDTPVDRRGTDSYKWDTPESQGVIPMWVADMDFRTAPVVTEALHGAVDRGIFGYTVVPDRFYEAVTGWFSRRHGWDFCRQDMLYTTGVVPAVSAVIKAMTNPGDGVALLTPAYNCFFSSIRNNGCSVVECPLVVAEDGRYEVDYDALHTVLNREDVKVFIMCNPHNPGGRVWNREELLRIGRMCLEAGVLVLSDEIHCELVYGAHRYIPFASIDEEVAQNTVTCISPSKSFNTAGLQIAMVVSPVKEYRERIDRAINDNEVCDVNPFGIAGLMAAYTQGEEYLDALVKYLCGNFDMIKLYFAESLPELAVMPLEGTYLAWIDIKPLGMTSEEVAAYIHEKAKVRINPGTMYGQAGEGYIRINFACPRSVLQDALERITSVLKQIH